MLRPRPSLGHFDIRFCPGQLGLRLDQQPRPLALEEFVARSDRRTQHPLAGEYRCSATCSDRDCATHRAMLTTDEHLTVAFDGGPVAEALRADTLFRLVTLAWARLVGLPVLGGQPQP